MTSGTEGPGARAQLGRVGYIRKLDRSGRIEIVAGNGVSGFNGDGLKGKLTSIYPVDLAVDRCGNLIISDADSGRIRRLNLHRTCR